MTIRLIHTEASWLADFVGDSGILAGFGTTVLPTPFKGSARYEDVRAMVQQRNPGYEVI